MGLLLTASEKEEESDRYLKSVIKIPTDSRKNPITLDRTFHGFGIYLDENILRKLSDRSLVIGP